MRLNQLFATRAPAATILIRLLIGDVLLVEGVQNFLYPAALGAGRFAKIGIPAADVIGPFVGIVETLGGIHVIVGLFTRQPRSCSPSNLRRDRDREDSHSCRP
jgi:uncharacterized membrane protein YphA (DoxX/SURF4 family)